MGTSANYARCRNAICKAVYNYKLVAGFDSAMNKNPAFKGNQTGELPQKEGWRGVNVDVMRDRSHAGCLVQKRDVDRAA